MLTPTERGRPSVAREAASRRRGIRADRPVGSQPAAAQALAPRPGQAWRPAARTGQRGRPAPAKPQQWFHRLADPDLLAMGILFATFLAGGFSFHRLDPELRRFGELAYARTWLVAALAGILLLRRRRRTPLPKISAVAWFAHAAAISQLYIGLTALWSPERDGTFPRVFGQIMLAVLIELALAVARRRPRQAARWVLELSLAAGLVYAVAGLAGGSENGRMAMFFGGPNVFIRVVAAALLAAVYCAVASRRPWWLGAAPLLLVCGVESGSRGGMLALLFTLPVLAWALWTSGVFRRRPAWWLAAPLAVGLVVALAGMYVLSQPAVRRYVEERYLVYAPGSYDAAGVDFGSRDVLFRAALDTFWRRPTVGSGLSPIGDFAQVDAHPHNLFLATLRDGGIVGAMLLSVPFALLGARLRRRMAFEHRMALVAGSFYLCAAQFSGSYYDCRFLWLYFLVAMLPAAAPRRVMHPVARLGGGSALGLRRAR